MLTTQIGRRSTTIFSAKASTSKTRVSSIATVLSYTMVQPWGWRFRNENM